MKMISMFVFSLLLFHAMAMTSNSIMNLVTTQDVFASNEDDDDLIRYSDRQITLPILYKKPIQGQQTSPRKYLQQQVQDDSYVSNNLGGGINVDGIYYLNITIGEPKQSFDVQLDTGSSDLLVYADGCSNCSGNPRNYYDPKDSDDSSDISCDSSGIDCDACVDDQCEFVDEYGDGSEVKGLMYYDMLQISGIQDEKAIVGAITTSTTDFEPAPADGIFGLAYSGASSVHTNSNIMSLIQGAGMEGMFSFCLSANNGGLFTMGGYYGNSATFVSLASETYYQINVQEFQFNGDGIDDGYEYKLAIVDSGTTLMTVPSTIYDAMSSNLSDNCDQNPLVGVCDVEDGKSLFDGYCYEMSESDISAFPTMDIVIGSVVDGDQEDDTYTLSVPPSDYLIPYSSNMSRYVVGSEETMCLGIMNAQQVVGEEITILGDLVMQSAQVIFDFENNRVGFSSSDDCPQY